MNKKNAVSGKFGPALVTGRAREDSQIGGARQRSEMVAGRGAVILLAARLEALIKFNEAETMLPRISFMEYRGIEFSVVQAIERGKWKWTVAVPGLHYRTGLAASRDAATAGARRAISWLLAAKKRELENA
jgi:hypothetical protein